MKRSLCAVVILSAAACSSSFPYVRDNGSGVGYSDKELEKNVYEIQIRGHGNSKPDTLVYYFHRRAGELCEQNPYTVFETMLTEELMVGCGIGPSSNALYMGKIKCAQHERGIK